VQLVQMGIAYWQSSLVLEAARLNVADHLAAGRMSAEDLAATLQLDPGALRRFLRSLAGLGLFSEGEDQRFSVTALGAALCSGAPGLARSTILTLGGDLCRKAWERLPYSLATGETGFDQAFGLPIFDYLAAHPDEASLFSEAMIGIHGTEPPAVADAYDFNAFDTIVDVGGATGNLLVHVLGRHTRPRGVLYDLPHVVRDAPALVREHGLESRVDIEAGSFFDAVPAGHDAYILSHVIHDWDEEKCLAILGNCRRAMKPDGKVLLVEMVLPEGDTPHFGKLVDMMMLVGPGGEERSGTQYAALLERAGLRLERIVPTASDASIVESVAA